MLEAAGIFVHRGTATLLDDVSVSVRPGEILGIIGPNGAGKSTLLRVLAGLEPPAAGDVTLDGAALASIGRQVRALKLSFLPQGGTAEAAITVGELVALGRLPHGAHLQPADRTAIERAMVANDVLRLVDRSVTTLSGGELARALFARVIAVEADYLLADEPSMSLDPRHQIDLMDQIRKLADTGRGVALVLHDLALAVRYCDRLALLQRGRVMADLPPEQALTPERMAAIYGVDALTGRHEGVPFVVPWRAIPREP